MLEIIKDPTFAERNIPLGILEVTYPDRSAWDITKFYDLVHAELDALRGDGCSLPAGADHVRAVRHA